MSNNYSPRGTSQTTLNGGWNSQNLTAGDSALLQQNAKYELLSQQFVGSISPVIKNGVDITVQAQNALLAIKILLTLASAQAYQPTVTVEFWSTGITDWLATYTAQIAYAKAQGW